MSFHSKVAFVHIPRTGGMSFGATLASLYKGRKIADFYGDETGVANRAIAAFVGLSRAEKDSFSVLKGHFVYGFDSGLSGFTYVTFLRRPIDRLISYYYYALRDRRNYLHRLLIQRRMKLEEFLGGDISMELDNYQVRAVSGISSRERVTALHLAIAKENLRLRFVEFGLTEQYDRSMAGFARLFGWPVPDVLRENEGAHGRELRLSQSCLNRVSDQNRYDLALYDYAVRLFDERSELAEHSGFQTS